LMRGQSKEVRRGERVEGKAPSAKSPEDMPKVLWDEGK